MVVPGCVINDHGQRYSSLRQEAKTLCEVMADPHAYEGRRIMMKGLYVQEVHQRVLYDAGCPKWEFRVGHSLTAKEDRAAARMIDHAAKKDISVSIPVIYAGIFTVKPFIIGCSDRDCYHYSLEEAQLLAASPRRNGLP